MSPRVISEFFKLCNKIRHIGYVGLSLIEMWKCHLLMTLVTCTINLTEQKSGPHRSSKRAGSPENAGLGNDGPGK